MTWLSLVELGSLVWELRDLVALVGKDVGQVSHGLKIDPSGIGSSLVRLALRIKRSLELGHRLRVLSEAGEELPFDLRDLGDFSGILDGLGSQKVSGGARGRLVWAWRVHLLRILFGLRGVGEIKLPGWDDGVVLVAGPFGFGRALWLLVLLLGLFLGGL